MEELDLMMASALKRTSERRSVSKSRGLKRTTDFAYLIYEYFRPTECYDEIQ